MFTSLRARLIAWYTAMLAVVVVLFGLAVCYVAWRARLGDVDARLASRAAALAAAVSPAPGGTFDLTLPPDPPGGPVPDEPAIYHALWTPHGSPIDRSDPEMDVPMPEAPGTRTRGGRREVTVRAAAGPLVLAGLDLAAQRAEIWSLAGMMAAAGLVALGLALAGGWLLVGRALAPIDRISRTARSMVDGNFHARIPIDRVETELGQLARALNEAFDRLQASLERQRRFTADASHELRTPLTTISTESQWALARDRDPAAYQESLASCRRAAQRMAVVVERLLALAREESGAAAQDRREPVRLDLLVAESARAFGHMAAGRGVELSLDASRPVTVSGDADRLFDAISNLVVNAIQYNREGGHVRITLGPAGAGACVLRVTDTGTGMTAEDLARVFEPFFRADPARSREAGGAGLGLAVARATIERHGGRIHCTSEAGRGTEMRVELPVVQHAHGSVHTSAR